MGLATADVPADPVGMHPPVYTATACLKAAHAVGAPASEGGAHVSPEAIDMPVVRPFIDGLVVVYYVDIGSHYQLSSHRDLAQANLSPEQLHGIGLDNLIARLNGEGAVVHAHNEAFFLAMGGDFEAAALLVDGFWDGPARQFVAGDVYALAPARDMLGFCSVSSASGIAELQAMQARCAQSELSHALHNHVLVRQSGRWSWARGQ